MQPRDYYQSLGRDELRNSLDEQSEAVRIYKQKCNGVLIEKLCP